MKLLEALNDYYLELVLGFLTVLTGIVAKFSDIRKILSNVWAWVNMFVGGANIVMETLREHSKLLESIKYELSYNSGKSTKDFVRQLYDLVYLNDLRQKHIFSLWPVGLYECEPKEGRCIWVNDTLAKMFGLEKEAMLEHGWLAAVDDSERDRVFKEWKYAIEQDIPYSWTYTIVNQKTMNVAKFRTTVAPLRTPDGRVLVYYGTVEQISSEVSTKIPTSANFQ